MLLFVYFPSVNRESHTSSSQRTSWRRTVYTNCCTASWMSLLCFSTTLAALSRATATLTHAVDGRHTFTYKYTHTHIHPILTNTTTIPDGHSRILHSTTTVDICFSTLYFHCLTCCGWKAWECYETLKTFTEAQTYNSYEWGRFQFTHWNNLCGLIMDVWRDLDTLRPFRPAVFS